ncbi:MAG: amidohydrolase/deacetylase family metallohydrolase [Chloroflexi bacterium]|nr:amidohydrolase/deacetylase family metallohydrolase [Chloroflexota bacterium]
MSGTAQAAETSPAYDLLLAGGTVIDPASGRQETADVAVYDGRVAAIGPGLTGRALWRVDCRGAMITPGLIDFHVHIFAEVTTLGAPAEAACLQRGVTTAVDAGSAGCWTFAAFARHVARQVPLGVYCFLNVAATGILDIRLGENRVLDHLLVDDAVALAARHPDLIKGFKVRLGEQMVGNSCRPVLERARAMGDAAGLPLMLHIGETPEPLPEILHYLRPGDVVSHCYTGNRHGILQDGALLDAVRAARDAGVLYDSAHGSSHFSYAVARRAIEAGFLPDTISSDNSLRNWRGPVHDLPTTMAKFVALGVPFLDVLERVTWRPAQLLGLAGEGYGRLQPGGPADLTVLRWTEEPYLLRDSTGEVLQAPRLEPLYTVRAGHLVPCVPWRGVAA